MFYHGEVGNWPEVTSMTSDYVIHGWLVDYQVTYIIFYVMSSLVFCSSVVDMFSLCLQPVIDIPL